MVKGKEHSGACRFDFDSDNRGILVCQLNKEPRVILLYGAEVLKEMKKLGFLVGDALKVAEAIQG